MGGAPDGTVLENWMEEKWVGFLMRHSWKMGGAHDETFPENWLENQSA